MPNRRISHIRAKLEGSSVNETFDIYDGEAVHGVVNNLTTTSTGLPLDAAQGPVIAGLINNASSVVETERIRATTAEGTLSSRIDAIANLSPGSTTGDAELIDIRTGEDGTPYSNAGSAVRGQIATVERSIDDIAESNVLIRYDNATFKTTKATWQYYEKDVAIPSGTKYIHWNIDGLSYDGTALTSNFIWLGYYNNSTNINGSYITSFPGHNSKPVPSNANSLKIRIYTNGATAYNNTVTVNNFYVAAGGMDKQTYLLDDVDSQFIDSNAIVYVKDRTYYTTTGTWKYASYYADIPENTKIISIYIGSIVFSNTSRNTNFISLRFRNSSGTEISNGYLNKVGPGSLGKWTVPDDATEIEVRFYTNTSGSDNTWMRVQDFYILAGSHEEYKKYVGKNLWIGEAQIDEFSKNAVKSKNLFTSEFKRGALSSSTGAFVAQPTGITNTATEEWIPVKANTTYTFSWKWNEYYTTLSVYQYQSSGEWISDDVPYDGWTRRIHKLTFKTNANAAYIRIQFYSTTSTSYDQLIVRDAQLELGGVATPQMTTFDISKTVNYDLVRNPNLKVPDYYFTNGYLSDKANTIRNLMFDAAGNYDAFIFVTDTHWEINQQHSPALINYLTKDVNINKVFHGGDIYDTWSTSMDDNFVRELKSSFDGPIYYTVGNHEYKGTHMDDPQIWYFLNSMHKDIVPGNPSRNYYYIDNPVQKIRYICLNVYGSNGSNDAVATFESAQATWFQNVALNVSSGWDIVVFVHAIYEFGIVSDVRFNMDAVVTPAVTNIIDNYSGNGRILCVIQGHSHRDRITSTPGGTPVIVTTCDKNGIWYDGQGNPDILETRTSGTIDEQAFDVFVIDKTNSLISIVRIGCKARDGVDDDPGDLVEMRQISIE